MKGQGIVYLVGAGPGDPELITLRGYKCLRQADVIVYDRLVNDELLDIARDEAERIYVGKQPRHHTWSQDEINGLLVARARAGQVVVRLKGGDPFVFGRGGEEALACADAGVVCQVVPGVSSAIGVPAAAGIPVTQRGMSGSFAVVTAQRADACPEAPNWAALAAMDTLVILMGVEQLEQIVACLVAAGKCEETPSALVENGTLPDQRVLVGTLRDITEKAHLDGVHAPATIIIGEVVRIHARLQPTVALAQGSTLASRMVASFGL